MKILEFDQFIHDLPWSDNVRHKLRVVADRDDVRYLVAIRKPDGKLSCSTYTDKDFSLEGVEAIWSKRGDDPTVVAPRSRTMQAVDLVLDEGMTVYAASKQAGVNQSAVHRALRRRDGKDVCPSCGQVIRAVA